MVSHIEGRTQIEVSENRVLRTAFGLKRDEVTRGWREFHNEELQNLYCTAGTVLL